MSVWGSLEHRYVIAEAGLNHNGDFDMAIQLIEAAAEAGADAVKFQKRDVDSLAIASVLDAPDSRFPSLGKTYRELRERHEFSFDEFQNLKARAQELGVDFFVTPFDLPSLNFLEQLGVDRYKIASHGLTNLPLLKAVAKIGKPVLLSTGMADIDEVAAAVEILRQGVQDLAILHCVSSYPTPADEARLDLIGSLKEKFGVPIGYSGHEIGYLPSLIAIGVGAQIIERHVTLDKALEGFDHKLSLTPMELREMVTAIREVESMFGHGEKFITDKERVTRLKYQVSMVSSRQLTPGQTLSESDFVFKNPGTGLPPARAHELIGRQARVVIEKDVVLLEEMFD